MGGFFGDIVKGATGGQVDLDRSDIGKGWNAVSAATGIGGIIPQMQNLAQHGVNIPTLGTMFGHPGEVGKGDYATVPTGLPGQDDRTKRMIGIGGFADAGAGAAGTAFQNADYGMAPYAQAQQGLMGQLQQQAQGQGPSAAQQMMQNAQQQNVAQAYALAASQNGMNPALAQRMAQQQAVAGNQQIAGQGMAMRAQEQLNAQQQLAGLAGQGMNQQLARGGQFLQQQQQLGELAAKYEQMGLSQSQALMQAQLEAQRINAGLAQASAQNQSNLLGGVLSGISGAGAAALGA